MIPSPINVVLGSHRVGLLMVIWFENGFFLIETWIFHWTMNIYGCPILELKGGRRVTKLQPTRLPTAGVVTFLFPHISIDFSSPWSPLVAFGQVAN